MSNLSCPLCAESSEEFRKFRNRLYLRCQHCHSIFLHPTDHLDLSKEEERYLAHINDVNDPKYQNFVRPLVNEVMQYFPRTAVGLDFGAGTGPATAKLLSDSGYLVELYDPFFWNHPEKLTEKYDYIIVCEVMEHFRNPSQEFSRLRSMLNQKGKIFCMTSLYSESLDFENWYYKNDQTHLFFYHQKAIEWIRKHFQFSDVVINEKLIILTA